MGQRGKENPWRLAVTAFFSSPKVISQSLFSLFSSLLFSSLLFSSLFYLILFYSLLFYSILCCSIQFYSILLHSILFFSSLLFSSLPFTFYPYTYLFYYQVTLSGAARWQFSLAGYGEIVNMFDRAQKRSKREAEERRRSLPRDQAEVRHALVQESLDALQVHT